MEGLDLTNALLSVIGVLGGIMIWIVKSFSMRIVSKLEELDRRQVECVMRFADSSENSEAHRRIFGTLEGHERRISVLESMRPSRTT